MDVEQFKQQALEQGYPDQQTRTYPPGLFHDMHRHDVSYFVLVVRGEVTLATRDGARLCRRGDTFKVAAGTRHSERVGDEEAELLLAHD